MRLGVNRWRTFWNVAVLAARPALVAGTVLATARALGESVMLSMVSGSIGFAPNPMDGLIFFFEPSRGLAATILHNTEQLSSPPMKHTLFAIAAVLLFSSLMLSLIGWATKMPMSRYFLAGRRRPMSGRSAVESSASWRLGDRLGLAFAWSLGLLFCAICAAIVIYLLFQGIRYLSPDLLWTNPKVGLTQNETGGFLAPLLGTIIATSIAMALATPIGVGVAVWLSEYARPRWLARVVESTVEMFAGAPSIVLALFGVILFRASFMGFLTEKTGWRRVRQGLLPRRGDAVAAGAAAGRHQRARGSAGDPEPCSGGLLRASARRRSPRSGACCYRRCAPTSSPAR